MSFLDELPVLLRESAGYYPTPCNCPEPIVNHRGLCELCGEPSGKEEQMMYICSLHRKAELSQEVNPDGTFWVFCLVCGAFWNNPEKSIGEHPDDYADSWLARYQSEYFQKYFGVSI